MRMSDCSSECGLPILCKKAVTTRTQQEQLLQRAQRLAHRNRRRERSEVTIIAGLRAPVIRNARIAVRRKPHVRIALVVAIHDVVSRPEFLDEVGFEEQRFVLRTRSEEHTSELQSLMRISYAVFCSKKKKSTQ